MQRPNTRDLDRKVERLHAILDDLGSTLVAFSGGVDSTFLLHAALERLGEQVVAITALSPSYPPWELEEARALAAHMGARMVEVETDELTRPGYRANDGIRCYHCKSALFEVADEHVARLGFRSVCYGAISDDLGDHRPGMEAAAEHEVRAPLVEAGLTKAEIRLLSRAAGLSTWDKPATACLASRFPDGIRVDGERLLRVGRCEERLRLLGLVHLRARFHDDLVRVELGPDEQARTLADPELRAAIVQACKAVGFRYVALDLEGYRTGSGNTPGLVAIEG
jgi:uncharacterized protein